MPVVRTDVLQIQRCAAGTPPDTMTPVRAHGTGQQHNRSAESSVSGTIVFLGDKAWPEYRRAADQAALEVNIRGAGGAGGV